MSTVTNDPVDQREQGISVCPTSLHNVTSGLSVTALLYSNVMRIITGSSNDLQVTERERALAEEIRKDTRFVTQVSGHLGCHDRSKVRAQDELKEKIKHAKEEADKAKAHLEELEEDSRNSKWDLKHEGFVMQFITRRAEAGEIPPEVF
jgi:hypothetical protein